VKPEIEKIHILYKNLIRVGKELDFERFKGELVARGFVAETRILQTPTGPFKEYLLREPKNLRDLIVVSSKGFVVDAWNYDSALELVSTAYEIYEFILGDLIRHILVDILGDYQLVVLINRNSEEVIGESFNNEKVDRLRKTLNREDLRPFAISFAWGKPVAPHEWVIVSLTPIIPPGEIRGSERLQIRIQYRHVNPDTAVEFLHNLQKIIKNILSGIL